jgi:glutamine amidotransferase
MIGVVNYGIGNLQSVAYALEAVGAKFELISDADRVSAFAKLLVPGVGAFGACMDALTTRGFKEPVLAHATHGKPLLGICVGMQLLAERGTEFGDHDGLGLISGTVVQIERGSDEIRLPHIGWNPLIVRKDCRLLRGLPAETSAYFVHSFHLAAADTADVSATVEYGSTVTAAVSRENVFGVQFHPEKSQLVGLTVLRNFAAL